MTCFQDGNRLTLFSALAKKLRQLAGKGKQKHTAIFLEMNTIVLLLRHSLSASFSEQKVRFYAYRIQCQVLLQ